MRSRSVRCAGSLAAVMTAVALVAVSAIVALAFSDNRLDLQPSSGTATAQFVATFHYFPTTGPCPPGTVSFVWDFDRTHPITLGNSEMDTASCSATLRTTPPASANGEGRHQVCGFYASAPGSTDACSYFTIQNGEPQHSPPPAAGGGAPSPAHTAAPAVSQPARASGQRAEGASPGTVGGGDVALGVSPTPGTDPGSSPTAVLTSGAPGLRAGSAPKGPSRVGGSGAPWPRIAIVVAVLTAFAAASWWFLSHR